MNMKQVRIIDCENYHMNPLNKIAIQGSHMPIKKQRATSRAVLLTSDRRKLYSPNRSYQESKGV